MLSKHDRDVLERFIDWMHEETDFRIVHWTKDMLTPSYLYPANMVALLDDYAVSDEVVAAGVGEPPDTPY